MRIAIVKLSALVDIVQAMVVLQFIKTFNQKIVVDWFVEESYKELLVNHPHVNEVYVLNFKKVKRKKSLFMLLDELSKVRHIESYDVVIDMQGLIKSAIVSRLIPSEKTFGFDKKSIRESLAARFYTHKIQVDYAENIIKRNIILISKALELSNINNSLIDKYNKLSNKFMVYKKSRNNIIIQIKKEITINNFPDKNQDYHNEYLKLKGGGIFETKKILWYLHNKIVKNELKLEHLVLINKFIKKFETEEIIDAACKIVHFGWKKEAIPVAQLKKSLFSRLFDKVFS